MAHKVIDNFLTVEQHQSIQELMLGDGFPWYFNDYPVLDGEEDTIYNFQFTHLFYFNNERASQFADILNPILEKINPKEIYRIKANLSPSTPETRAGRWHNDFSFKCKTAVYYLNDNNGFTKFRSGEVVSSVANRFVVFDSQDLHLGASSTDVKARCLINFNYEV
jgi:hypothetical protein